MVSTWSGWHHPGSDCLSFESARFRRVVLHEFWYVPFLDAGAAAGQIRPVCRVCSMAAYARLVWSERSSVLRVPRTSGGDVAAAVAAAQQPQVSWAAQSLQQAQGAAWHPYAIVERRRAGRLCGRPAWAYPGVTLARDSSLPSLRFLERQRHSTRATTLSRPGAPYALGGDLECARAFGVVLSSGSDYPLFLPGVHCCSTDRCNAVVLSRAVAGERAVLWRMCFAAGLDSHPLAYSRIPMRPNGD